MAFQFGTKAETLQRLSPLVSSARFCDQLFFFVEDWAAREDAILDRIARRFEDLPLAVRSSAKGEDGWSNSMAGAYHSVIGVTSGTDAIRNAIEQVIDSYPVRDTGHQVLVQPAIRDVAISGVIMSRDLDTGSPYYVINYDDFSGRTDSVTGGDESKTILVHRSRPEALRSPRMRAVVDAVIEIEKIAGHQELDIEFCTTTNQDLYILQVRPLAASRNWSDISDDAVDKSIDQVRTHFADRTGRQPGVAGERSIFGQMPDWNPAEMIGGKPKPLAYSLYSYLITDTAWAVARAEMGYRNVTGHALMTAFAGQPYVDVRLSLNSFLPADVEEAVAEKLVVGQLSRLSRYAELHDKIEFQIAIPTLDFAFEQRVGELEEADLSVAEIAHFRDRLGTLTQRIVKHAMADMRANAAQIDKLEKTRLGVAEGGGIDALKQLLDVCIVDGTIPFAKLARHAFTGVSFLKSLVQRSILDRDEIDNFLASIHTVASEFVADLDSLHKGDVPRTDFLSRYGHLRPGTYDITSPRYDSAPELYLKGTGQSLTGRHEYVLATKNHGAIERLLAQAGLEVSVDDLFTYIAEAVRLRELAKFNFTRVVSDVLEIIATWGSGHGLDREELAFLSIDMILAGDAPDLESAAIAAEQSYQISRNVRLPQLIASIRDVDVIRLPLNEPTYITQRIVTAHLLEIASGETTTIDGQIVVIESGDPGFDWIFSHNIAGLVTKFGGANSHMAIRCAEFGLPAAIGCGERLFGQLVKGRVIELNCMAHAVRVVSV